MLLVPLIANPNQTANITLGGQAIQVRVYQGLSGLYMDVLLNNAVVIGGVICENLVRIIRNAYFGVVGDFCWFDTQGTSDPVYSGIGSRYYLIYLETSDISGDV